MTQIKMTRPLEIQFIYNKTNKFGLKKDCELIEAAFRHYITLNGFAISKARHLDLREPPRTADIQFHMEIPSLVSLAWSSINFLMVNPEYCFINEWKNSLHQFDGLLCKDEETVKQLEELGYKNVYFVPWSSGRSIPLSKKQQKKQRNGQIVAFCGGSSNKVHAVAEVICKWLPECPKLTVYTTRADSEAVLKECIPGGLTNIVVINKDLTAEERQKILQETTGYLGVSLSEGFGHVIAEAEAHGCFLILNEQPVYRQYFTGEHVYYLQSTAKDISGCLAKEWHPTVTAADLTATMTAAARFEIQSTQEIQENRWTQFIISLKEVIESILNSKEPSARLPVMPPVLITADCPPISIITLVHNRRKFTNLAFHNMMITDYPRNKIEWVVVEDSDHEESSSDLILPFADRCEGITITYIPLQKSPEKPAYTIGEKRNIGVEKAQHDIVLFMDDDDHYPVTSFRRRVAWLQSNPKVSAAVCTMIACYDLQRGISAVNVPPWGLSIAARCSEATLTFRRKFWEEHPFPSVNIAEGEEWLRGREEQVMEIPPQQIIVAFSHGKNTSARRIPGNDNKPGCFWGFPRDFLEFIHGLVGVKVEAA